MTGGALAGRVALVTGASRGIGRACALALAAEGARVAAGFHQDKDGALETLAGCASGVGLDRLGGASGGAAVQVDVRDAERVQAAFDEIERELGPVEILVNNAGVTRDRLLIRMSEQDWYEVVQTNLSGVFRCTKRAIPGMLRNRWGRVISIGSVAGALGNPGQANYSAAKAGVVGFTRALAREVASKGITANVVVPGLVDTAMTVDLKDAARETLLSRIPMGRAGSPEEVAEAVCFFARASYVTGQTIVVDGGLS
jgi:3-oxoacyl-[acyl-carrier protein] reductase